MGQHHFGTCMTAIIISWAASSLLTNGFLMLIGNQQE